ncbi:MAG: hypothetical protein F6K24_10230 [Okeania sp. SIO2D1]|nr:hypothetical protein [Okeania sp. SIO2D1]
MSIAAIYGKQRRGKSLFAVYYGLFLAQKYQKRLVANFPLKPMEVALYCRLMNYTWLSSHLGRGIIHFVRVNDTADLIRLFKLPDAVIVFDEAAVYLPSRGSTYNTPTALREAFVQVGHDFQHLLFIAQNQEQVDSALRSQAEEVFHCSGTLRYSHLLRNDALLFKTVHRFEPDGYEVYNRDPKIRRNPLKVRILANKSWTGFLKASDAFIFRLYDSFIKLSSQKSDGSSDDFLFYHQLGAHRWVIAGDNPYFCHNYSGLIAWLFKHFPSKQLPRIIRLDKRLATLKVYFQPRTPLERGIVKGGVVVFFLMVLGVVF